MPTPKKTKISKKVYLSKFSAVKYIIKNEVYSDEWSGAGMYEALRTLVNNKTKLRFSTEYLNELLENAKKF